MMLCSIPLEQYRMRGFYRQTYPAGIFGNSLHIHAYPVTRDPFAGSVRSSGILRHRSTTSSVPAAAGSPLLPRCIARLRCAPLSARAPFLPGRSRGVEEASPAASGGHRGR